MNREIYQEPLVGRYTSKEMQYLFSEQNKFETWRKCWIALAEAQHELGLHLIKPEMIDQMNRYASDIDFEMASAKEKEIKKKIHRIANWPLRSGYQSY